MRAGQPAHEPAARRTPQMQAKDRYTGGACGRDLAQQLVKVLAGVGELWQHRRDHHVTVQAGGANCGNERQPRLRCWRTRLDIPVQLRVANGQRHRHRHRHLLGGLGDQRQVPSQQGALDQDRQRRTGCRQRADDARHQGVAALRALVGVGVGAQRDGLAPPGRPAQLVTQHSGDVGLDHHLGVEVGARIEVQVLVGGAGETIATSMRAAAVAVDGVAKRQRGRVGHLVQR